MRNIFIVNATQVVVSESHPEGMYSVMSGYPKTFDSRNYDATEQNPDGDPTKAMNMARAEYLSQLAAILRADNPTRVMATVTLERSDGVMLLHEKVGDMPTMIPPEPEPEPDDEPAPEEPVE